MAARFPAGVPGVPGVPSGPSGAPPPGALPQQRYAGPAPPQAAPMPPRPYPQPNFVSCGASFCMYLTVPMLQFQ